MRLPLQKLSILDKPTRLAVHKQAIAILREKGFRIDSKPMRKKLKTVGAHVDEERGVVCLPEELIADALRTCPSEVHLYDLDGNALRIAEGTAGEALGTYTEGIQWLDYGADSLRPSILADLRTSLRIADALPVVRTTGTIVWPTDVPLDRQLRVALKEILITTRKPFSFGLQNEAQARLIFEALSVAAPTLDFKRQPPSMFIASPTSPLVLDNDSAAAMVFSMDRGLVPVIAPCPMAGGTSQFSVIGTVLQQVVENLFMVTVKFALAPEAPVIWGGAGAAMDMKTGDVSYGAVERSLMMLANIDMARHYNLPCHSPAASVDSCRVDAQCGAEKTWTYLTRLLSGAAVGMAVGAITNGKAVSAEQMVIDADIIRCLKRLAAGIETGHLKQGVAEILAIEHGGNFMMADATLELIHDENEYFIPPTFNRAGATAKPILERAHEQVRNILGKWRCPVSDRMVGDLEALLR